MSLWQWEYDRSSVIELPHLIWTYRGGGAPGPNPVFPGIDLSEDLWFALRVAEARSGEESEETLADVDMGGISGGILTYLEQRKILESSM